MSYDYSENILVQESAGHLLADELGWQVEFAYNQEILGVNGTLGRNSYKEVLLVRYFQQALRTLNPWITDAQVIEAQNTFEKHLSSASLMQINEEKYAYLRDGIPVTEKKPNGQTEEKRAMIIDFSHPNDMERNHFFAVKEMKIHGDLYRRRTDIVGFVNGIPLLFIELKKNSVDVQNAYTDNYTDYLDTIPQLFYYNAFLMLSNGVEAKVGTLGSKYEFFHEWKRLSEQEQGSVALETMLRGICRKENFLDLLENFILFDHSGGKTVKILARNHQYLGVKYNELIDNLIKQAFNSSDSKLNKVASYSIVELHMIKNAFPNILEIYEKADNNRRKLILEMIIIYFGLSDYKKRAKDLLNRIILIENDVDNDFLWGKLFRDKLVDLELDKDLVCNVLKSKIKRRVLSDFVNLVSEQRKLKEYYEVILEVTISALDNRTDMVGYWSVDIELSKLIIALYDVTANSVDGEDKVIAGKCLDIWDNYRLEKGCATLRNSSMSVTDVAYACGFSGTSYFCEFFHRHYGIMPNEYRKESL